jgi:hypothetical protein
LFSLGASVYGWTDPLRRLFLETLAMVAKFEANLRHPCTREAWRGPCGGKLKGKQPKFPAAAPRMGSATVAVQSPEL